MPSTFYRQICTFNEAALLIAEALSPKEFSFSLLRAMAKVVAGDLYLVSWMQFDGTVLHVACDPDEDSEAYAKWQRLWTTHSAFFVSQEAGTISDFCASAGWQHSSVRAESAPPVKPEDALGIDVRFPSGFRIGLWIVRNRGRFSAEERQMFSLLRGHVMHGYEKIKMASHLLQLTEEVSSRGAAIVVDASGIVRSWNGNARALLSSYDPATPMGSDRLPSRILHWFLRQRTALEGRNHLLYAPTPLVFIIADGQQVRLHFTNHPARTRDEYLIVAEVEKVKKEEVRPMRLSRREQEVLKWVSEGKTNAEIGVIIGICSGTVRRHLENIYGKLGVGNRIAAAKFYLEKNGD